VPVVYQQDDALKHRAEHRQRENRHYCRQETPFEVRTYLSSFLFYGERWDA